jgi:hypothetical protein
MGVKIVGVVLLLGALLFVGGGGYAAAETVVLLTTGERFEATVLRVETHRSSGGGGRHHSASSSQSTVVDVRGQECVVGGNLGSEGETVAVRLDPANPRGCVADSWAELALPFVAIGVGLIVGLFGVIFVRGKPRRKPEGASA